MRTWAVFCYGLAVGILAVWIFDALIGARGGEWLPIAGGAVLAVGLLSHQRHISLSRGRRWRKTTKSLRD